MKYWKQITALTLFSCFAHGQSLTYKVIKDTPDDFANYWVNVGLFDMGFATENPGFGLLGASLNTVVHYKNKFGGEATYRKYYVSLAENEDKGTQFEIGGFYNLFSKQKSKNQKVVLSQKSNGKSTTTITMKVPATIRRTIGVRAGFNSLTEGLDADSTIHGVQGSFTSKSAGIYAGVLMTTSVNVKSHTSEYGIKGAGFVRRNYLDILFNPINPLFVGDVEYLGSAKLGALGFRLGIEFLKAEPKKVQGSAIYQKLEIGSRPIDGYYAMYSLGFNFKRKVKSMSSFVVVREKE